MIASPAGHRSPASPVGAYGFRLTGLPGLGPHLNPAEADWPQLKLVASPPPSYPEQTPGTIEFDEGTARLWLAEAGCVEVTRSPLEVAFGTAEPLAPEAILHPFLGLPAAIAARWRGRLAFHAAAFAHAGRCWALLGDRGAGKSTTLALMMDAGCPVVTDDVLIVGDGTAFSGPRCVDLRRDASWLGGQPLGVIGSRERWRLRPRSTSGSMLPGGWIDLAWGDALSLRSLPAGERLQVLARASIFDLGAPEAPALLELASLPAWRLTRPYAVDRAEAAAETLLRAINRL